MYIIHYPILSFHSFLYPEDLADIYGLFTSPFTISLNSIYLLFFLLVSAAIYGDGNYFAVNSSYSVSYAKPDMFGYRYMYLAKVLVGEYTQGKPGMKAPPKKGIGTDLYDSVVDSVHNPSIFVVFPDNQAYPEYLICFK